MRCCDRYFGAKIQIRSHKLIFFGTLGCTDEDKELTIFSKHLDQVSMLWSKDGTVNWIDSNLRSRDLWILPRNDDNNSTFELDEDEYVNQEEWQADGSCDDEIQRVHHLEYNVSVHVFRTLFENHPKFLIFSCF